MWLRLDTVRVPASYLMTNFKSFSMMSVTLADERSFRRVAPHDLKSMASLFWEFLLVRRMSFKRLMELG
jgi:hypothetical protein